MKIITVFIKQNYWLISILMLGSFLRIFKIDFQSLWMDEIYTMNVTDPDFNFTQFHDEVVLREGFPYLYFLILKASFAIFGYTGAVARMVSALAGIASIYATYRLGKEIFNKEVALIASFLLSVNEFHIYYSQEARPYTLYILFFIITLIALSKFIRNPKLKTAVKYGVATGLLLNINFFSVINIVSQAVIILFFIIFSGLGNKLKIFKLSLLSALIALVMFLPNYEILIKLLNFKSFWIPAPTDESFSLIFSDIFGNYEITRYIFQIILIYYFIQLFNNLDKPLFKGTLTPGIKYSFIVLFFNFILFTVIVLIKSYSGTSLLISRYFVSTVPLLVFALAIGVSFIKYKFLRNILISIILFFSLFNLFIKKQYYSSYQKSQYREIASFVKNHNEEGLNVYTSLKYWYDYYFRDTDKTVEKPLEQLVKEMMDDSSKIKSFWYAEAHGRPYQLSEEEEGFLEKYFFVEQIIEGFDAWARKYVLKEDYNSTFDLKKIRESKDSFNYNIEELENDIKGYRVSGWAFFEGQDAYNTEIKVLLAKKGETEPVEIFHTTYIQRTDVAPYFKSSYNLNNCGFSSIITIEGLEPGRYNIALYLDNSNTNRTGYIITDKVLIKE